MPVPVNIAKIVGHRQMRRRAEIGKRHRLAGKPVALLGKPVDIVQMDMKIGHRGPHHLR